jgi:DNA ligase 1
VTEKLDGCRGYWDGERMWSRSGRAFAIPESWRESLPKIHLDGEIWAGHGKFTNSVAAVARNSWTGGVCFMVFDAPNTEGTWRERISQAQAALRTHFAAAVPWQIVKDVKQLARIFRAVGRAGGEGLILRCPQSQYTRGRCARVLKLTRDPITGFVWPGTGLKLRSGWRWSLD